MHTGANQISAANQGKDSESIWTLNFLFLGAFSATAAIFGAIIEHNFHFEFARNPHGKVDEA